MTAFRVAGFSGLVPRLAKQLLGPSQAQVATNCNLTSGDLRPRNGPLLVATPVIATSVGFEGKIAFPDDATDKYISMDMGI